MYFRGNGVPQDYAEAARWLRLAADGNDPNAHLMLGVRYQSGRFGLPKDYVLAHMWFTLAVERFEYPVFRDAPGNFRDEVAKLMTPDQIAEAQRLAREWKPTKPK